MIQACIVQIGLFKVIYPSVALPCPDIIRLVGSPKEMKIYCSPHITSVSKVWLDLHRKRFTPVRKRCRLTLLTGVHSEQDYVRENIWVFAEGQAKWSVISGCSYYGVKQGSIVTEKYVAYEKQGAFELTACLLVARSRLFSWPQLTTVFSAISRWGVGTSSWKFLCSSSTCQAAFRLLPLRITTVHS